MRLLLDQGLPLGCAKLLRESGIDTAHTTEIGYAKAEDSEILALAFAEQRTVVTLDSDFHTILALSYADAPSVIRIRIEGLKASQMTELLETVLNDWEEQLLEGYALSVQENGIRAHRLPLIGR